MLQIYADAMMAATRTNHTCVLDVPSAGTPKRRRWFASRKMRCVDLSKL